MDASETLTRAGGFVGAVLVALLATWLVRIGMGRLERRLGGGRATDPAVAKRARTLTSVLTAAVIVVIWIVALITGLDLAGVPVGPLLAAAGIGGVALGFGAQNVVRDLLAGMFILSEGQYDVGDHVAVAGVEGTVEAITLRSTVLRGLDGARHVVSNGEIRVSSNNTRLYSRYLLRIPLTYDADVERALDIVRRTGGTLCDDPAFRDDVTGPPAVLGVDAFTENRVEITAFVETVPGRQWAVGREFRRRLAVALAEEGVTMAPAPPPAG